MATAIYIIADYYQDYYDKREYTILVDFTKSIQTEISVVSNLEDGYIRQLYLPDTIQGKTYNITNEEKYISIIRGEKEFTLSIPKIQGTLVKGNNTIEKRNDIICVNC